MSEQTHMPDVLPTDGSNDPVVEIVSVNQRLRELFDREPEIMNEVKHYFELLKIDYAHRVSEIEKFLGFAESSAELGARLHRVESFLGIKVS